MRWKPILVLGALLLGLAAQALPAQGNAVSTVDLSKRDQRFSSQEWSSPGMARLNQSQAWPGARTVSFGNWHGRYSSLGRKLAPVEVGESRSKRMANLPSGLRPTQSISASSSRSFNYNVRSPLRNFNRIGNASAMGADERLQGLISTEVEVSRDEFAAGGKTPALQDINRFNFRKNGANTSGPVPVTPAAGGDQPPAGDSR